MYLYGYLHLNLHTIQTISSLSGSLSYRLHKHISLSVGSLSSHLLLSFRSPSPSYSSLAKGMHSTHTNTDVRLDDDRLGQGERAVLDIVPYLVHTFVRTPMEFRCNDGLSIKLGQLQTGRAEVRRHHQLSNPWGITHFEARFPLILLHNDYIFQRRPPPQVYEQCMSTLIIPSKELFSSKQ